MVFVHHAFAVPFLWSGVDLFFILSGYLITNILLRDSARVSFGATLRHFYVRRAQRIIPAYVVCLALISMWTRVNWSKLWPYYAFFLQNVPVAFHLTPFGPLVPLWSLAVEQQFYLAWPVLVFFLPRRLLGPVLVTILLAVPVLRWTCTSLFATPEAIYSLTPFRIDTMAAGALAALWLPRVRGFVAIRYGQAATLLAAVALAVLRNWSWFSRSANSPQFNGLAYSLNIVLFGGFFLWVVLLEGGWLYRVLSWRPLRALGQISYSFYLLHLLILLEARRFLDEREAALLAFVLTGVLAALSWKFIEQPILALRLTGPAHTERAISS